MFICPTCYKKFKKKSTIKRHFLICWKEQHPFHQSQEAPHSEDIEVREVSDDIMNFFNSFAEAANGRS